MIQVVMRDKLQSVDDDLASNFSWLLSNLARSPSPQDEEFVKTTVPIFLAFLQSADNDIIKNVAWGLNYITENDLGNQVIQTAILHNGEASILSKFIKLASGPDKAIQYPISK